MIEVARTRRGVLTSVVAVGAIVGTIAAGSLWAARASLQETPQVTADELDYTVSQQDLVDVAQMRVFFAHRSVGENVLDALPALYAENGVEAPAIVEASVAEDEPGTITHAEAGTNREPLGKIANFDAMVRSAPPGSIDVALLKLCFLDINRHTDVNALFETYSRTIAELERDFPQITFVHVTTPLKAEPAPVERWKNVARSMFGRSLKENPANNVARTQYNDMIRAEFGGSGQVFDLAAMQSTAPDGSRVTGTHDSQPYEALYAGYTNDGGHFNPPAAQLAAADFVTVIAAQR